MGFYTHISCKALQQIITHPHIYGWLYVLSVFSLVEAPKGMDSIHLQGSSFTHLLGSFTYVFENSLYIEK